MAVIPYNRFTNLQNDQALNPTDPYPAVDMDAEYNALKITTDDLIQHLELIQDADGSLANGSVGRDQIDPFLLAGLNQPFPWLSGNHYLVGNTVFSSNNLYFCEVEHTSGVFATDLAAGKWLLLVNLDASTVAAQTAATNAAASALGASTSATSAATSATNAATSATSAATSASAAAAANAFPWKYDTSTTMADPGTGDLRFNNATLASVTQIAFSALSSVSGNPDVSDWIVTWDDSTNTSKGQITIRKNSAPQNFVIYRVTGAVTDVGVFVQVPVVYVTHSGSFASTETLNVEFTRTGDAGVTTVVGGVPEAPTDSTTYGRRNSAWTAVTATSAATVPFSPAGNIAATDVQAALQELDGEKLALSGVAPMTGDLTISKATAALMLKTPDATTQPQLNFYQGTLQRWTLVTTPSAGGGSDFGIARYDDAGSYVDTPLIMDRADGRSYVLQDPITSLGVATKQYVDAHTAPAPTNVIINGDFRINQSAYVSTAALAAGAYGHDQWKAGASGGDYSFTQLKSSTQITIGSGKSLIQPIEDVNVAGGSYVLSWTGTAMARAGVNTLTPSGTYAPSPLTISGQTAGTSMSVEFNNGTLGTVKLEGGSNVSVFVMRPFADELVLCQRYWHCSNPDFPTGVPPATHPFSSVLMQAASNQTLTGNSRFPVVMRTIPTITVWRAGVQNTASTGIAGVSVTLTPPLLFYSSRGSLWGVGAQNFPYTAGGTYGFDYQADARL